MRVLKLNCLFNISKSDSKNLVATCVAKSCLKGFHSVLSPTIVQQEDHFGIVCTVEGWLQVNKRGEDTKMGA